MSMKTNNSSKLGPPPSPIIVTGIPSAPGDGDGDARPGSAADSTSSSSSSSHPPPRYWTLVKKYTPTDTIDWTGTSFKRSSSTGSMFCFEDDKVQAEFIRFMQRDLAIFVIGVMYMVGCFFYAGVVVDMKEYGIINYVIGVVCIVLTPIDAYLHVFSENTVAVAKWRQLIQIGLAIAITIPTSFTTFYSYHVVCDQAKDLTPPIGPQRPEITPERIRTFCRDIHNPFLMVTLTATFITFPLPPSVLVLLYLFTFFQFGMARVLIPHPMESSDEIITKCFVVVGVSCICWAVIVVRYRMSQGQFRQTMVTTREMQIAAKGMEDVDLLMCSMLPPSALARVCNYEAVADYSGSASVMFADMVHFTKWSSERSPHQVSAMLNILGFQFDTAATKHGVEKIKTIGDGLWAVCGLPEEVENHAERLCDYGNAVLNGIDLAGIRHPHWGHVEWRIGIHSGPLAGGVLGNRTFSYEVFGQTNRVAARVEKHAIAQTVTITHDTWTCLRLPPFGEIPGVTRFGIQSDPTGDSISESSSAFGSAGVPTPVPEGATLTTLYRDTSLTLYALRRDSIEQHRLLAPQRTYSQSVIVGDSSPMQDVSNGGSVQNSGSAAQESARSSEGGMGSHFVSKKQAMRKRRAFLENRTEEQAANNEIDVMSLASFSTEGVQDGARANPLSASSPMANNKNSSIETSAILKRNQAISLADIETIYSQRKYQYLFYDNADDGIEASFRVFAQKYQKPLRQFSRVCTGLLIVLMIASVYIERGASIPTVLYAFCAVSFFFTVVDLVVGKMFPTSFPRGQVVFHYIAGISLVVGAGLSPEGTSVSTNDVTYIYFAVTALLAVGNVGLLSSAGLTIANVVIFIPIVLLLIQRLVMYSTAVVLLVQVTVIIWFTLIVAERQYRVQFKEQRIDKYFQWMQDKRKVEQQVIFNSMVPLHVVPDLMQWVEKGLQPKDAPSKRFPKVCVAFVEISPKETAQAVHDVDDDDLELLHIAPEVTDHQLEWLSPARLEVDTVIEKFPAIDKIKTIGEIVMMAGSFTNDCSHAQAVDQIVAAALALSSSELFNVRVGIHVGEIVGAVIGTKNVCFDIFGDAVNVSSRAMSGGQCGVIQVTEEFYLDYSSSEWTHKYTDSVKFSKPRKEVAKGKGYITVRTLLSGDNLNDGSSSGNGTKTTGSGGTPTSASSFGSAKKIAQQAIAPAVSKPVESEFKF